VPALCDSRCDHLGKVLKTDRALNITGICHVEYHLHYMAPFDVFIWIMQVQHIVITLSQNEFECWLYTVVFERPISLRTPSLSATLFAISIWVIIWLVVLIVLIIISIIEPKQEVCVRGTWACAERYLFLHRFHQMQFVNVSQVIYDSRTNIRNLSLSLLFTLLWIRSRLGLP
jgi:hypothetical protein